METSEYSYSDLDDKLQNYVIQSNEENFGLQYHNGLNVEPIFAEVDCTDGTWTQYELPILMNGSLISGITTYIEHYFISFLYIQMK